MIFVKSYPHNSYNYWPDVKYFLVKIQYSLIVVTLPSHRGRTYTVMLFVTHGREDNSSCCFDILGSEDIEFQPRIKNQPCRRSGSTLMTMKHRTNQPSPTISCTTTTLLRPTSIYGWVCFCFKSKILIDILSSFYNKLVFNL